MPHFIDLFFTYHGSSYPFLAHTDIASRFLEGTLSPLLANIIASLAAPYVFQA
jgi:hypothetical protein